MKQESLGKEIIRLALPATVENIFQTLVGFVDTLLIAQLGLVAVTAVGLANTILNVYLAVYMALGVGATALIARSIGAGDRESLTFHVRQALVLSVGVGLLLGLLSLVFGRQMLVLMGADVGLNGSRCGEFGWRPGLFLLGWWFDYFSGLDDYFGNNPAGIWGYSISYENELTDQWF
ncbi:MATE efflux family protein [Streptococcus suis]|nr:MATE efflux family protein [Streptococcus suis]